MTTSKVNLTGSEQRESFEALLGLAAREVFRLMLGCELQNSSEAPTETLDVTAMVGLAFDVRVGDATLYVEIHGGNGIPYAWSRRGDGRR